MRLSETGLFKLAGVRMYIERALPGVARYVDTVRLDRERDPEGGYVRFAFYDSVVFGFGFSGAPYSSIGEFLQINEGVTVTEFAGRDFAFIENPEEDFSIALERIHEYSRLRLTDKFLEAYARAGRQG
ncbi:hypothetical protein [Leucobacter iarius]|uniref:Uncharacterized protein n=1 Tax=Leucobacter iarius TaxID=333963 RepID=A0ABP4XMP3_9MICO